MCPAACACSESPDRWGTSPASRCAQACGVGVRLLGVVMASPHALQQGPEGEVGCLGVLGAGGAAGGKALGGAGGQSWRRALREPGVEGKGA